MYDIVSLVRTNGLCDEHNLQLNVYVRILEYYALVYINIYIYKYA